MRILGSLTPTNPAKGGTPLPAWFNVSKSLRASTAAASSGEVVIVDEVFTEYISASVLRVEDMNVQPVHPPFQSFTFESSNEAIATVDAHGRVTRVSDGTVEITATSKGVSRSVTVNISLQTEGTASIFNRFADGSLSKIASADLDALLVGKSVTTDLQIFNTQNHATQTYVRNSNLWCQSLVQKLTCASPWNSRGGTVQAGTLVSPRHPIFCNHFPNPLRAGDTLRFVGVDGTAINRTLLAVKPLQHTGFQYPDITVGVLDADLPETITPCVVMPQNHRDFIPTIANNPAAERVGPVGIPGICLDQQEKALVSDLYSINAGVRFWWPTDVKRLEFYEDKISGDSGNPAFMIVNGVLVLLTVWTGGGGGSGTNIGDYLAAINQLILDVDALASISTGYTLSEVDLSDFTNYGGA